MKEEKEKSIQAQAHWHTDHRRIDRQPAKRTQTKRQVIIMYRQMEEWVDRRANENHDMNQSMVSVTNAQLMYF